MNNQFATQYLLQNKEVPPSLESQLQELGAEEITVEMLVSAVSQGAITPGTAIKIVKAAVKKTTGVEEMSTTGGGVTGGPTAAAWDPQGPTGTGEQMAAKKAFGKRVKKRKYQEDAPRLAGDPAKTNNQGTKNLTTYKNFGFTKAPNAEEAGKHIKGVEVEELWEEDPNLNESRAYSRFKREAATRSKSEQMHEAVKTIHKKLEEVSKLLEFTQQMKGELSEEGQVLEYRHNTMRIFEKINSKVVEIYSKSKKLNN